jgi:hypothetical protein
MAAGAAAIGVIVVSRQSIRSACPTTPQSDVS